MRQRVLEVLSYESDNKYAMLDSSIVNTELKNKIRRSRRNKGSLSTKIHARTDALGNPTGFFLTDGQAHDLNNADVLLDLSLSQT